MAVARVVQEQARDPGTPFIQHHDKLPALDIGPRGPVRDVVIGPGPAKTSFGAGLVSPPPMDCYADTPSGEMRRAIAAGNFALRGDAGKMARAMIDSADRDPAPRRLTLGSDAYARVRAALVGRLADLEAQEEIAVSTDS